MREVINPIVVTLNGTGVDFIEKDIAELRKLTPDDYHAYMAYWGVKDFAKRCEADAKAANVFFDKRDAATVCAFMRRYMADGSSMDTEETQAGIRTAFRVLDGCFRSLHTPESDDPASPAKLAAAADGRHFWGEVKAKKNHAGSIPNLIIPLALQGCESVPTSAWFAHLDNMRTDADTLVIHEAFKGHLSGYVKHWTKAFPSYTRGQWIDAVNGAADEGQAHDGALRVARDEYNKLFNNKRDMTSEALGHALAYGLLIGEHTALAAKMEALYVGP